MSGMLLDPIARKELLVDVLKISASEGLPGVRTLVEEGLAPAVVLGVFSRLYDEHEQ